MLVTGARRWGVDPMSQADTRIAIGKARESGGQRAWRAALYTPAGRYTLYRVTFQEQTDDGWTWTARTAPTEAEARRIFSQVEKALDAMVATPVRASVQRGRTGKALAEAYLAHSRAQAKAVRTIEQRENRLRRHIEPVLGDLPVAQWRLTHSRKVIEGAKDRGVKSISRLADIRQDLAAMRKLAWREGWLPRDVDPLDGLALPRQQTLQGAGRGYVPPDLRPSRRHVDAMTVAADHLSQHGPQELSRLPMLGTQIRVAGYAGLRLGGISRSLRTTSCGCSSTPTPDSPRGPSCSTTAGTGCADGSRRTTRTTPGRATSCTGTFAITPPASGTTNWAGNGPTSLHGSATSWRLCSITTSAPEWTRWLTLQLRSRTTDLSSRECACAAGGWPLASPGARQRAARCPTP